MEKWDRDPWMVRLAGGRGHPCHCFTLRVEVPLVEDGSPGKGWKEEGGFQGVVLWVWCQPTVGKPSVPSPGRRAVGCLPSRVCLLDNKHALNSSQVSGVWPSGTDIYSAEWDPLLETESTLGT